MAQQIINNGEIGLTVRNKINQNFTELYDLAKTLYVGTQSVAIHNIDVDTTWQTLDQIDTEVYSSKISQANGIYSFISDGGYDVRYNVIGRWDNSEEVELALFKNGVQVGNPRIVTGFGGSKDITIHGDFFSQFLSTDTIEFKMRMTTGTARIDFIHSDININRIF